MPGIDVRNLTKRQIFDKITSLTRIKLDMLISLEDVTDITLEIEFYRKEFTRRLAMEFLENL